MISAKQAREKSEQNKQDILNKEMEMIESEINNAISKGVNSICIDCPISPNAKQMLGELGYKVKCGSLYNQSYVNIEW